MTTFQIIGLIVVALLGLYVFYCLYNLGKANKKKEHRNNRVLTVLFTMAAVAMGTNAWAQVGTFTVTNTSGSTFTITRTSNTSATEKVRYRTVSLSAIAGHISDYASRFKLVFNAVDDGSEKDDFAFISNGEIIINGDGLVQVFDLLGHQLNSHESNSEFRIPNSAFPAGVYVLRLINGENVKTQKIIIK